MRKTMGESGDQLSPPFGSQDPAGVGRPSFGHSLDMLARTAASSHPPGGERYAASNPIPAASPPLQRPTAVRVVAPDSIRTTWSTDLSGIDPVERSWLDLDTAKALFDRQASRLSYVLIIDFGRNFSPPSQ